MRTRTLLLSAAVIAAGLASSQAQSNVFSANIVGYVNQVWPAGQLVCVANPLSAPTNDLNGVLAGIPNKSSAQFWNGSGFTPSALASGSWTPNLPIPPGVGFFVNSKTAFTNTWVGNVLVGFGQNSSNALPAGVLVLVGSQLPFAPADLNDTNLNLVGLPNKSSIQMWNGTSFVPSALSGGAWTPAAPVPTTPAQGFFVNAKTATNWIQSLPANP